MISRLKLPLILPLLALAMSGFGARAAVAQDRVVIPQNTVVRVELDDRLTSERARVGDRFSATISPEDTSGFPSQTRLEGTITQVQRATRDRPGIIDMQFRRAVLPDGRTVSINGTLASLSDEDVRRTAEGRLESRRGGREGLDLKWVGYGAGAGAILGAILGDNLLTGALLGGLGGAIYGYLNREQGSFREVALDPGTEFGVRLEERVAFNDRPSYRYVAGRAPLAGEERVAGQREEYRASNTAVLVDGRRVTFTDSRPMMVNGTLYVPLEPVARAANMRYEHPAGSDTFTLDTRQGRVTGYASETNLSIPGRRAVQLTSAPIMIEDEIYVPAEFFTATGDMRVNWDRPAMRLSLETYR